MDLVFKNGTELIAIRINQNKTLTFGQRVGGWFRFSSIEGLKLSIAGILDEFPDLEDKPEPVIRKEGVKRLVNYIKSMKTEEEICNYLKEDLKKYGYVLIMKVKKGHRPTKIK